MPGDSETRQPLLGRWIPAKDSVHFGCDGPGTISKSVGEPNFLEVVVAIFVCGLISSLYIVGPLVGVVALVFALFDRSVRSMCILGFFIFLCVAPIFESRYLRTCWVFRCVSKYFDVRYVYDCGLDKLIYHKKRVLCLAIPHGVISFGGLGAAATDPPVYGPTAMANVLFRLPLLRNIFSLFGAVKGDKRSIIHQLETRDVILYPGGLAELFLSSRTVEELYLKKRKGCIKLAIEAGVDILPCYLIGNTQMFDQSCNSESWISRLSRRLRLSFTVFWGRWYLPIPYRTKVFFVIGKPIETPKSANPTQEEVDRVHSTTMDRVTDLFEKYKHLHPAYKNKKLLIN